MASLQLKATATTEGGKLSVEFSLQRDPATTAASEKIDLVSGRVTVHSLDGLMEAGKELAAYMPGADAADKS